MSIHLFTNIVNVIQDWATHGGYFFLLLISIVEAVPLLGTTVPGHTAVILSGFLARIGVFNLWIVIVLASLGAIVGDMIGFYLGKKYGMKLLEKYKNHFFFKEEYIEKTRSLIQRNTGKALILGRFNPLTRPFSPFVVGASHSSTRSFWFFNILGGILWATLSVMAGYIFGIGYGVAVKYLGSALLISTIFAVIVIWGYKMVNARFHIFRKYELFSLILGFISFWGLFETMQDALATKSFMVNFDIWVNAAMTNVTPALVKTAEVLSTVGGTAVSISLGILITIILFYRKRWRSGAVMLFSIASTSALVELMKAFFMRTRPENALQIIMNDPSFPSGHASLITALLVIVAYLVAPKIHSWVKRELVIVGCVVLIMAVGLSRLVLNVHWASDVIAGWSLGVFCASASILLVRYVSVILIPKLNFD